MALTLTQAVSRVAARLNKNASDTAVYARIKNHINDTCQERWHGYAWSFRYREYPLVTTARVSSGTMTATNGSKAITASGTPFVTASHTGAWIRFVGDTVGEWYRIQTVGSTSAATIEPAYQGTSGSGKSYELCVTDYPLPSELTDTGSLLVSFNRFPVRPEHITMLDGWDSPPTTSGAPMRVGLLNDNPIKATYTTGTVSGTAAAATLTGSGTAWLANVQPGDTVTITGDTNTYTVYKVDSDTQITLYNYLATSPSGAAYISARQFPRLLRVWPCPDQAYVGFVKGLRSYPALVATTDTNELLDRFPAAVIEGAVWREASSSPDPREDSLYQKSELLWSKAQGEDEAILSQHNYSPIWNPRGR